jgi:hypothetical protein
MEREVVTKMSAMLSIPVIFLGTDPELGRRLATCFAEIIWEEEYRIAPVFLATPAPAWRNVVPPMGRGLAFVEISVMNMAADSALIRELREVNGNIQIVLMADDDADYFAIAQDFSIGNVLKKQGFDAAMVRALTIRLLTGNIFGFTPYFPYGFSVGPLFRTYVGRVVVEEVIEECFTACKPYVNPKEVSSFKIFLHELLTNTFSYAIEGITPEDRDAKLLHAPPIVNIPERRAIKISLVTDDEKVGFSVQDSTGSLSMLRVLQKLRRQSRIGGEQMPPGIWDESGRGISMVYRYSRLIVNILKDVRTETIFLQYHRQELNRFESIIITEVQAF